MRALSHDMGLTNYIVALIKHPDLTRADPGKAAAMYGIKLEWAEEFLRRERERRRAMK